MSTATLGRVPFIPERTRRAHHVYERSDDRFRAAARARQALLREANGWPIGLWASDPECARPRKIGSYLSEEHHGHNLLTPAIAELTAKCIAWREEGALVTSGRIWKNMISSYPSGVGRLA